MSTELPNRGRVIMPTFNRAQLLRRSIRACGANLPQPRIDLVDDCSPDNTSRIVREFDDSRLL